MYSLRVPGVFDCVPGFWELNMNQPYDNNTCFVLKDLSRPWQVVRTKARHEKKLADECIEIEIPCFLPLRAHQNRKNGRIFKSEIPMFPGYMFVRCTLDEKQELFRTGRVAGFLEVNDQDGLRDDLLQIKKVIELSAPVKPHPFAKVGTWVRIKNGPFQGLEGLIVSKRTGYRFVVNVRMIKRAVAVDVDAEFLELA